MVRWFTSQINFCFTNKTQGREPQDPGLFPVLCPTRVETLSRAFNPQSGTETPHQPSRFVRGWPPRAWGRRSKGIKPWRVRRKRPHVRGEDFPVSQIGTRLEKHPHMRGEDNGGQCHKQKKSQPPPRAWGRHSKCLPDWAC